MTMNRDRQYSVMTVSVFAPPSVLLAVGRVMPDTTVYGFVALLMAAPAWLLGMIALPLLGGLSESSIEIRSRIRLDRKIAGTADRGLLPESCDSR